MGASAGAPGDRRAASSSRTTTPCAPQSCSRCGTSTWRRLDFASTDEVLNACDRIAPDVVFLDIALHDFDAIDVVRALGNDGYRGAVQLVSGHHSLLDTVQRIGEGTGLTMLEPVRKPFRASEIRRVAEMCGGRETA